MAAICHTVMLSSIHTTKLKMNLNEKTEALIEAMPYIKKYRDKIIVVKFGGNAISEIKHVVEDIIMLKEIGIKPVIVHGGGPEIDKELKKAKISSKFINGLRYTDEAVLKVVENVFERINNKITSEIGKYGISASNATGAIKSRQKEPKLGLVGEITAIDADSIIRILDSKGIPVISPLGIGDDGKKFNINADTAASNIAVELNAEKLTILTNVDGVIIHSKVLSHLNVKTALKEIKNGNINNGMIPKVLACIYAVKNRCPKAHLINGLVPHSLLLEIFTDKGVGTEIVYKNGYNGYKKSH